MYAGLDALVQGAVAALVVVLPALVLFWRLTARLAAGPRALRPFVTGCASYGAIAAAGGAWAFASFRPSLVDEAIAGLLLTGAAAALLGFLVLLLFPRPPLPPQG
jgi:hypothetical protein